MVAGLTPARLEHASDRLSTLTGKILLPAGHLGCRQRGGRTVLPYTNVRAAHATSPMISAAGGQGRLGHVRLSGWSLMSCHAPRSPSRRA